MNIHEMIVIREQEEVFIADVMYSRQDTVWAPL